MMQKHRKITLERVEKFHTVQSWTDVNLRSLLYSDRSPVASLRVYSVPQLARIPAKEALKQQFVDTRVGESFGPSWSTHWFAVDITVPLNWKGEVHFLWDAHCEGFVYVNGEPMQGLVGGDGCDRRAEYILTKHARGGERFSLHVELAANGMFGVGAAGLINCVDPDRYFTLKQCEIGLFNRDAWSLLWDMEVISDMAAKLPETDSRAAQALYAANAIQNAVWTDDPSTIAKGRQIAADFLKERNSSDCFTLAAIGHCHIDTAWLWPYAETRRKIARSWATQLLLIEEYKDLGYKFGASQAVQYAWLKQDYPSLYSRVKKAIHAGSFVPLGGTWVEMDCNIPSGESFCRQFLYGQRFFKEEFGSYCNEFWLPDTFGYSAQLPQIVRQSGIQYFLTQKLSWNLINKFPHHSFYWEGLDGSQVLTHFPPADTYNSRVNVEEVLKSVSNFKDLERSDDAMLLLGHGDGGGGAQAEMLERMIRMKDLRGLPRVQPMAPVDFFRRMEARAKPFLKWSGELYFELHRGTYTTHAQVKKGNRQCELLLREVEFWASAGPLHLYPQEELDHLWRLVLLNQFHDVLPGSSITDVYIDCHAHHQEVLARGRELLSQAFANFEHSWAPAKRSRSDDDDGSAKAILHRVYNSLPWDRSEVVVLPDGSEELAFVAAMAPGVVSQVDTAERLQTTPSQNHIHHHGQTIVMENNHLVATFDTRSGKLTSLIHRATGREVIDRGAGGNSFVVFDDVNLFWDAWDTEVFHLEKKKEVGLDVSVSILQDSAIRSALKITMRLSDRSSLEQVVNLDHLSPRLDFRTTVNWNENRRFLKVEFPTTIRSPYGQATFETQFGHLQRPTHRNTSWDMAKFEVCGHKWADLSCFGFGVALLNDCKYGYAVEENVMRLSLIRSPKAPDPKCDIGTHTFTYSLMPHAGTFQESGVIQQGYNLNAPVLVSDIAPSSSQVNPSLFAIRQEMSNQVVLETVKRAQDEPNCVILRLYESFGGTQRFTVQSRLAFRKAEVVNVLEHHMSPEETSVYDLSVNLHDQAISARLTPFKVLSLKLWI